MPNLKAAIKRVRQEKTRNVRNRYQMSRYRTLQKELLSTTDKAKAAVLLKEACSLVDKLAKRNVLHKNNASHHKSRLTNFVNTLK